MRNWVGVVPEIWPMRPKQLESVHNPIFSWGGYPPKMVGILWHTVPASLGMARLVARPGLARLGQA